MAELPDGMPNISDEQLQKLMDQLKEMTEEAEAGGSIPGGTPPPIGRSTYGVMGYDNMYLFFTAIVIPAAVIGFFLYKLVSSLREKERQKEEKRAMKQQRKEKEAARRGGNKKSR